MGGWVGGWAARAINYQGDEAPALRRAPAGPKAPGSCATHSSQMTCTDRRAGRGLSAQAGAAAAAAKPGNAARRGGAPPRARLPPRTWRRSGSCRRGDTKTSAQGARRAASFNAGLSRGGLPHARQARATHPHCPALQTTAPGVSESLIAGPDHTGLLAGARPPHRRCHIRAATHWTWTISRMVFKSPLLQGSRGAGAGLKLKAVRQARTSTGPCSLSGSLTHLAPRAVAIRSLKAASGAAQLVRVWPLLEGWHRTSVLPSPNRASLSKTSRLP